MTSKSTLASLAAILVVATAARAQGNYKRDIPDSLAAKAKITEAVAAATAQKRFPKGAIQSVELEREDGHLKYSYDIATPGKSGIDEVDVDALTGKIIVVDARDAGADEKGSGRGGERSEGEGHPRREAEEAVTAGA